MRNVDVQWKGISRYEVLHKKEIRKKHEEFWKTLRLKKKVVIHPIFLANHFIYFLKLFGTLVQGIQSREKVW